MGVWDGLPESQESSYKEEEVLGREGGKGGKNGRQKEGGKEEGREGHL